MRYSEMKTTIEERVQEQTLGTRAAVSMGELRSIEVFVLGDVQFPGVYTVSSLATVLHALYESGGITEIGSLRDVRLIRGGELVRRIDLYELLLHGNARDDVLTRPLLTLRVAWGPVTLAYTVLFDIQRIEWTAHRVTLRVGLF
jgi:polysaccharide biosynthesis/export protein